MLLNNINNDILIYHPSYSGVYQDEFENDISTNRYIVLGIGIKTKNAETVVCVAHARINI